MKQCSKSMFPWMWYARLIGKALIGQLFFFRGKPFLVYFFRKGHFITILWIKKHFSHIAMLNTLWKPLMDSLFVKEENHFCYAAHGESTYCGHLIFLEEDQFSLIYLERTISSHFFTLNKHYSFPMANAKCFLFCTFKKCATNVNNCKNAFWSVFSLKSAWS